jgi:hypothetical protein
MRWDSATVVAALAGLTSVSPALAAPAPPPPPYSPGAAAVHQYREALPTSGGAVLPGARAASGTPLPPAIAARVRTVGGERERLLERVATSPTYGAPTRARPLRTPSAPAIGLANASPSDRLAAAARAFLDGAIGRLGLLLVLLAGMTALGLAATARAP